MNTHWRSRDAYKAAFMNIFLTDLQREIATKISEKLEKEKLEGMQILLTAIIFTVPILTSSRFSGCS